MTFEVSFPKFELVLRKSANSNQELTRSQELTSFNRSFSTETETVIYP